MMGRLHIIAGAFAILTILWIPLDIWLLPWPTWGYLAGLRLFSTFVFLFIALTHFHETPTMACAYRRLIYLLINPLIFFAASQWLFVEITLEGGTQVLAGLYQLLPFVIIAGLAVFPLTVLESLGYAFPILIGSALIPASIGSIPWEEVISTSWTLSLITGVLVLAGMIQLNYMIFLIKRVSKDTLTGAFTRRTGEELIDLYFHIAESHNTTFAVMFIDLDNFKSINDRYGHEAGDDVLKRAVEVLHTLLRRGDMIIRWGGEEFVVLLEGADGTGIEFVLKRILNHWFDDRPDGTPQTASIGVAERIADKMKDWPGLIECADQRMYTAKQGGRARAVGLDNTLLVPETIKRSFG